MVKAKKNIPTILLNTQNIYRRRTILVARNIERVNIVRIHALCIFWEIYEIISYKIKRLKITNDLLRLGASTTKALGVQVIIYTF